MCHHMMCDDVRELSCDVTILLKLFNQLFNTQVVEWLLGIVKHLPSDAECQKCLMGPCPQNLDLLPHRTRCLEKIIKAKKAKELAAARF